LFLLAGGRFRRAALIGTIITVIAQVYLASAFGSAAFVQPGIGRAYLRGDTAAAQALNADTAYGPAFMTTAGFAVLFWLIGTVFLVVALVRTSPRLRVPGILYALSAPLFIWSGQVDLLPLQQAFAGLLLTIAAVINRRSTSKGSPMTGELAPSGPSERSAVWVPYVVRRAERTFRKPVGSGRWLQMPPAEFGGRAPRFGTGHQWAMPRTAVLTATAA
jgi:hypothetical protein